MFAITTPLVQRRSFGGIVEITCDIKGKNLAFKAGQYFKVGLESLRYGDPKGRVRVFNALSSPNNSDYLTFAFVDSQSGYKKTLKEAPIGMEFEVTGPYGKFTIPENNSSHIILVADGIGITPCMSIALYATEEQLPFKITLFHSEQSPYKNDLDSIKRVNPNMEVISFSKSNSNFIKKINNFKDCLWYVAGPPDGVGEIMKNLLKVGIPQIRIKVEEFAGYSSYETTEPPIVRSIKMEKF
jgi:ferredoxin-NADP reductase